MPSRRGFFQWLTLLWGQGLAGKPPRDGESVALAKDAPEASPDSVRPSSPGSASTPDGERPIQRSYDLVIVGGGISGVCAAISAARHGMQVALVHNRPMLGGNSSSEVKLYPENSTTKHPWIKEGGILEELCNEDRAHNHRRYQEGTMNAIWDLVLYDGVFRESNITLYLNTHMHRAIMESPTRIQAVYCFQLGTEKTFELQAPLFVDSSGDGYLGYRAGAEFRWGADARADYDEPLAPESPDDGVMGNTQFFSARDTGRPVPFQPPEWAADFPTEESLGGRSHSHIEGGYWWIEIGAPHHPIHDNDKIVHEGLRHMLGVWDHIKNHGDHGAANYGLEFLSFWPYKREARRILGDHVLTQQDIQHPQVRPDDVAYGAWPVDVHRPGGLLMPQQPPYDPPFADENWDRMYTLPYGIPLRSLYSRNIENLLTAGRPISTSYVAFSSSRVLRTGAIVGQAVGAAAALCKKHRTLPRSVARQHATECQQLILRDDGHIIGVENTDPLDLARKATAMASSSAALRFPEPNAQPRPLDRPLAQIFPVSANRIETLGLLLKSDLAAPQKLKIGLRPAAHTWDFRAQEDLAVAEATVHTGGKSEWVDFRFDADVTPRRLYYVHTQTELPQVSWLTYEHPPGSAFRTPVGVTPADKPRATFRRVLRGTCHPLRLTPESAAYQPDNVITGTHRADMWTNIWISDPDQALPAWLELRWPSPISLTTIQLSFDTNQTILERAALFRHPDCVRDYDVEVADGTGWRQVASVRGNYHRRRVHTIDRLTTDRLRVLVHATNGATSARIYEIRVYDE